MASPRYFDNEYQNMTPNSDNNSELASFVQSQLEQLIQTFEVKKDENPEHNCKCKFCKRSNFIGYRYKCLICPEYDLCSDCYENKKFNQSHELGHLMVRFDDPDVLFDEKITSDKVTLNNFLEMYASQVHVDIKCDMCYEEPIKGLRIKCETCKNFDICYECYKKKNDDEPHSFKDHQMLLIGKEVCLKVEYDDIKLIQELGKGAFGTVFKAEYNKNIVACKKINVNVLRCLIHKDDPNELAKTYLRELNAYNQIKGDNVLKMLGYCTKTFDLEVNFIILTEFMHKGSLTSLLRSEPDLSYRRRLNIAVDIACGMSRIHDLGFIHRDIRPDNILVDKNYRAKIGDMGIAKEFNPNDDKHSLIGCKPYMPPEFFTQKYNQKLDVFTFGLTLNQLYDGAHGTKGYSIEIKKKSPVFYFFIDKCINSNPNLRPTSKQIESELKLFQQIINQFIKKIIHKYEKMKSDAKNAVFIKTYEVCFKIYQDNDDSIPIKLINSNSEKKPEITSAQPNKEHKPDIRNSNTPKKVKDKNNCSIL